MTDLERIMPTRLGRNIAQLLDKGLAPSEIDERLGLMPGFARNQISLAWLEDRRAVQWGLS
jgi:hypothetical protein